MNNNGRRWFPARDLREFLLAQANEFDLLVEGFDGFAVLTLGFT